MNHLPVRIGLADKIARGSCPRQYTRKFQTVQLLWGALAAEDEKLVTTLEDFLGCGKGRKGCDEEMKERGSTFFCHANLLEGHI